MTKGIATDDTAEFGLIVIGTGALLLCEGGQLRMPVTIMDARVLFGREEVLVEPRGAGPSDDFGDAWVSYERIVE